MDDDLCTVIEIKDTIVSRELFEEQFHCDLTACKGACCVEGDSGAPLEEEEKRVLEAEFESIRPYLRMEGIKAIEDQGKFIKDRDGDWVTPLRDGKECAYTVFDDRGTALCGIELAWKDGKSSLQKPVSCHLYPVRLKKYRQFTAVNYERWQVCSPACELGKTRKMPVYKFVKDALVRRFGAEWYTMMEEANAMLEKEGKNGETAK